MPVSIPPRRLSDRWVARRKSSNLTGLEGRPAVFQTRSCTSVHEETVSEFYGGRRRRYVMLRISSTGVTTALFDFVVQKFSPLVQVPD